MFKKSALAKNNLGSWSFQIVSTLALALAPMQAVAGWHFSLNGSVSDNNLGLSTQNSRSASASIAMDLTDYFRIGVTHRQNVNMVEGLVEDELTNSYVLTREETKLIANSLDLTIILYYGDVVVPYIQLGAVKKSYVISSQENGGETLVRKKALSPVPNGGVGVGFRLNKNFSLKISYSVSPGIKQSLDPSLPDKIVMDTFTTVGITYSV